MTDKALSSLTQGSLDTGDFIYGAPSGNSRKIQAGEFLSLSDRVTGPASSTDGNLPSFSGTGGKTLQDSGIAATELAAMPFGNDAFTKSLLHFDGADASTTFTDVAYGALTHAPHVWTAIGNGQIDTAQSKFGGASFLGDGTNDGVTTPDHTDFTLGSQDFTADCWFNCVAASGSNRYLISQADVSFTAAASSIVLRRSSGNIIQGLLSNGSSFITVSGTTQFTDSLNTGWHHAAFVRTGNTLKLFIDGVQEGSDVAFSGAANDSSENLNVGTYYSSGGGAVAWNGWIDESRLSVGIARWTENFTTPTLPYGPTP